MIKGSLEISKLVLNHLLCCSVLCNSVIYQSVVDFCSIPANKITQKIGRNRILP